MTVPPSSRRLPHAPHAPHAPLATLAPFATLAAAIVLSGAVLATTPVLAATVAATAATVASAAAPQGAPGSSAATVVINEFQYDDTGVDDREFVELHNRTTEAIDVSGWHLDCEGPTTRGPSYTIRANTVLAPRGFFVLGAPTVPNVDQVLGRTDLWPNGPQALTLRDRQGRIVDTLVWAANRAPATWDPRLYEGPGLWGEFSSQDGIATSWQRQQDGFDTDDNGADFRIVPITPGAANDLPDRLPYVDFFDQAQPEQPAPGWSGSFVPPLVVDPTVASAANPSALPPSPQGGRALVCWNPAAPATTAGSGTSCMLLSAPVRDLIFEAWVWFDATPPPRGEVQGWSLGFRGTTCSNYPFPDPSGKLGTTANGNTGVALTYQVTDAGASLWLVDHGSGGKQATVLGSTTVRRGVDEGWRRLRIMLLDGRVDAWFAGSFACGDGVHLGGNLAAVHQGGVYVGFRHNLSRRSAVRPFTADFLVLRPAPPMVEQFGNAVATVAGTPRLTVAGLPLIGWQDFGVRIDGLVPNGTASVFLSLHRQTPAVDLAPFGAPPGAQLLVPPLVVLPVRSDLRGQAAIPMPIACSNSFIGGEVHWQVFDLDPRLPFALAFGHSRGLTTTMSN